MTDSELAQALDIEENELAEAFGYCGTQVVDHLFQEDDYMVDTVRLQLNEDIELPSQLNITSQVEEDLAAARGYNNDTNTSFDHDELAAQFGYNSDGACDGSVHSQDRGSGFHDSDNESGGQAGSDNFTDGDSCGSCSTEDESSSSSSCSGDLAYDDPTSSSTDDGSTRSESISEGS